MGSVFLTEFLNISSLFTAGFLVVLIALFVLIFQLYKKKNISFSKVVIIGTILGLMLGVLMQIIAGFPENPLEIVFINETIGWFNLFGQGYMRLIQMIVAPLVLVSILQVIINISSGERLAKLVSKTLQVTLSMTAISAFIGIMLGKFFGIGKGIEIIEQTEQSAREITSISETLQNIIPSNIFEALSRNNIIGIVIFASIFGLALWWVNFEDKESAKPIYKSINSLHKVMINMANLILDFMPYAVIVLLANTVASRGISSILQVGKFILVLYLALLVQFFVQVLFAWKNGVNPLEFFTKTASVLLMSFTTRSSVTCLPLTISTLTEKLGIKEATASFVASFGTTAGMQGCAGIFPAMLVAYVCNVTGTQVDFTMIVMSIIAITIGSVGIAGIPGTATISATVSLSGVGLIEHFGVISPILAVDPLVDMGRTLVNVSGSMTNAIIVSNLVEKNVDKNKY